MDFKIDYIFLFLGWAIYFFLHSFLAANSVKLYISKKFKSLHKYYRLFYSTISTVGLFALIIYNAMISSPLLLPKTNLLKYFALIFAAFGIIVIKSGFKKFDLSEFLGLKPESEEGELVNDGIHKHIRHPLYLGTILIAVGYWLYTPDLSTLISVMAIFIYLAIGIRLEEKKLVKEFGEDYIKYQSKVPMLFPRIKLF